MITKVTILHTDLRVECGLAADGALSRKDLVRLSHFFSEGIRLKMTSAEKRERRKANRIFPLFLIFITAFPIPAVSSYARLGTGRSGSICK